MRDLIGVEYSITDKIEEFQAYTGPKLQYGKEVEGGGLILGSSGLLFEKGLREQDCGYLEYDGKPALFPVDHGILPFDPFAASFYMVSRYEEYLPFNKDLHNRFPAGESIALKQKFLHKPVVNLWALTLKNLLNRKYPDLEFKKSTFRFIPTYDIDIAWSYMHKGLLRTMGGYARSLVKLNVTDMISRTATLFKMKQDPYFVYDYLKQLQDKYQLNPIYFFLLGDFDEFDKNISPSEPSFRKLIKDIADYAEIGIHPSYASNLDTGKVEKEMTDLEEISRFSVNKSRQHYLMLGFPDTYKNLIELGITDEYTLGYTSHCGFRAGICSPYYFYNLLLEIKTPLKLHPFAIMDSVFQYYLKLNPDEVLEQAKPVIDAVKEVDGTLYSLWHNSSLSEQFEWKGWRQPYESILEYILAP